MSVEHKNGEAERSRRRSEVRLAPAPAGFGRLASPPHPVLIDLVYAPALESDLAHNLQHVLDIDAAHTVMLSNTGILPLEVAARVLSVNRELLDRFHRGRKLIVRRGQNRGLYLALEDQFVARLGREVGGAAHIARSRNDINATVTRMRLRAELLSFLDAGQDLGATLDAIARRHIDTVMTAYTHLQPAQPTTLAHYITGV